VPTAICLARSLRHSERALVGLRLGTVVHKFGNVFLCRPTKRVLNGIDLLDEMGKILASESPFERRSDARIVVLKREKPLLEFTERTEVIRRARCGAR
jgi:hypothetical protein